MNEGMHIHLDAWGLAGLVYIQVYWAMFTLRRCTFKIQLVGVLDNNKCQCFQQVFSRRTGLDFFSNLDNSSFVNVLYSIYREI